VLTELAVGEAVPIEPARRRQARRIDGQPEVPQDRLDDRPVLDGRQQAQPPTTSSVAVGSATISRLAAPAGLLLGRAL
jgi:hypothetical protein